VSEPAAIPGQLDVGEVLELVLRDEHAPAAASVRGELVAPADELVQAFAATLVARPQTQRTYERRLPALRALARPARRARGPHRRQRGALSRPPGRRRPVDATVAGVRVFLGHASVKTTSIYLASGEDRQEHVVRLRERGRATLDEDREAA
jgi:hypothetical protein